jgi:hypothetical protein
VRGGELLMTKPDRPPIPSADPMARALAQRDIDPNEVAKTFTHLRALYERAGTDEEAQRKAVAQWWRWLETVAGPGARAVIRSGRTQGYYRAIQDACRLHLRELEPEPETLVQALGWAVRLMRYYQSNPDALDKPGPLGEPPREQAPPERKRPPEPPKAPEPPKVPEPGQRFNNIKVIEAEAGVGIIVDLGLPEELGVIATVRAAELGGKQYTPGNRLNVEVIEVKARKSGGWIVFLRRVVKQS